MQDNYEVTVDNAGRKKSKSAAASGSRWWDCLEDADVHTTIWGRVSTLKAAWEKMATIDRIHDRIYENRSLRPGGAHRGAIEAVERSGFSSARLFVTTSIVDTFTSRISKKRSMPMFVVDEAEWSLKRKAQKFRRFLHAKLRESEFERLCSEIVNDCEVRGTGVAYIDEHDYSVLMERVHRSELFLEPREARLGAAGVRQIHWLRQVSREVLAAKFPEHAGLIADAPASTAVARDHSTGDDWLLSGMTAEHEDVVDVVYSWHLDSGGEICDGRRAICIENATLLCEEWEGEAFPFAFLHRYRPKRGFWGRGDVELLADLQRRVNAIVRDIQQNLDVHGKVMVSVNEQYDIPAEKLTGRYPFKLVWRGPSEPKWIIPNPLSPGQLNALETFIAKMHDLVGVSQWATSSKNPIGAGASGIALDTFYDIESERHAVFEDDYGHFRLDVARRFLDCGRAVVEREEERDAETKKIKRKRKRKKGGKTYDAEETRTSWMDVGGLTAKDWKDFALERGQYRMQLEPVNFIPTTRAGKFAAVKELAGAGVIPQWLTASLFDEPDLAHANRISLAAFHNVERIMEDLGDESIEAQEPEPEHGLELCVVMAKAYYNRAQAEKAPERVQQRYRDFMQRALDLQGIAASMPPAGAAMPGMPVPAGLPPEMTPMAGGGGGLAPPGAAGMAVPGMPAAPGMGQPMAA